MSRTVVHDGDRLADFTRDKRILVLSGMAVVIGVMSACVAWCLVWLIGAITNFAYFQRFSSTFASPADHHLGYWSIAVPIIGGLIIGFAAKYGSDKIRGHGIPEALEAILIGRSRMDVKVAILKPITSAISIGTGGPFGAEGPIIMTGGAFGSLFAQLFHLSPAERKTLLVAGAAGGMAAIFSAPVAAVLLAVELLLFEWKPRSFIPVAISSAVSAALRIPLLGMGPIFPVTLHAPMGGREMATSFAIGLIAGLASAIVTLLVYGFEDAFGKLPVHWMWWPAIGGVFVGIGGLINPHALGVGYDSIGALLNGKILGAALISLLIVKALMWSMALGSGTSGGVVAPLLMMGAALGAVEAHWIPYGDYGLWATVSMAAMMGGTMGCPLTAIVFTLELTHDLNVVPGLLLGCIAAHGVTVMLMRRSILTEKVARRGYHITREYSVDPLALLRVGEVMDPRAPLIPASMKLTELSDRIARNDPEISRRQGTLLVDDNGQLVGIVTRGDVLRALDNKTDGNGHKTVLDAGSRNLIVAYPDELLEEAVSKMLSHDVGRLPVVSRDDPKRPIGYLGRAAVMAARLRRLEEEQAREPGWIARFT
ncbi:MAG TPA: chloride channel protein [Blastocatellia bacterium]|nr:chloride channel protein [Blastocatellia bacterium]